MSEEFDIWQSKKDGLWYFHLKGPNGEIIAHSEGFTTKDNCYNGVHSVKNYAPTSPINETTEE